MVINDTCPKNVIKGDPSMERFSGFCSEVFDAVPAGKSYHIPAGRRRGSHPSSPPAVHRWPPFSRDFAGSGVQRIYVFCPKNGGFTPRMLLNNGKHIMFCV